MSRSSMSRQKRLSFILHICGLGGPDDTGELDLICHVTEKKIYKITSCRTIKSTGKEAQKDLMMNSESLL